MVDNKKKQKEEDVPWIRWILTFFGFAYILYIIIWTTPTTVFEQQYNGLRILASWLYIIWVAIITKD